MMKYSEGLWTLGEVLYRLVGTIGKQTLCCCIVRGDGLPLLDQGTMG
jgi:hypothetical protein